MKRGRTQVLYEAVIFGVLLLAIAFALGRLFSGGKYPDLKAPYAKTMILVLFLSGALLHIGFEITGGNERFCRNFIKQIQP
jgi:hypothetical protein